MALKPAGVPELGPDLRDLALYLLRRDVGPPAGQLSPRPIEQTAIGGMMLDRVSWEYAADPNQPAFIPDGFVVFWSDGAADDPRDGAVRVSASCRAFSMVWPTGERSYAVAAFRNTYQGEELGPPQQHATWNAATGGTGGGGSALVVKEDGSSVVAAADTVNVIEPDDTIVTASPAGTARIDLSKYFLFAGRPGFQFGAISLDNIGGLAGTLAAGGVGAFLGGGPGASGAQLLIAPSFDLTNNNANRNILVDINAMFGPIVTDDASILNFLNASEYHIDSSTHDIVISGYFWSPVLKFGAGLTHDTGINLFAAFATLTCDVDVAPGPTGLDDIVPFLNGLFFVPTNSKTMGFKKMIGLTDKPIFDTRDGDVECDEYIASVYSQPRAYNGGFASPHIPIRYGLYYRFAASATGGSDGNTPTDSGTWDEAYALWSDDVPEAAVSEVVHSEMIAGSGKAFLNDVGGAASYFKGEVNFGNLASKIDTGGFFQPAHSADAAAPNDSVYYSTDAGKLVYKDGGGTVHNLY